MNLYLLLQITVHTMIQQRKIVTHISDINRYENFSKEELVITVEQGTMLLKTTETD